MKILDIQINDLNDILSITNLTSLTELTIWSPFINIAETAFGKVTLSQETAEQLSNMPALTKIFLNSQQIIPTTRKVRPTFIQTVKALKDYLKTLDSPDLSLSTNPRPLKARKLDK